MEHAEIIVVGLGAAGSATLFQLARRGVSVIGIDRFSPPHAGGSSGGETRITRLAIGEGAAYTPLVMRSHEIWRELEAETGAQLLVQNGGIIIQADAPSFSLHGSRDFLATTIACARRYGIEHEELTAQQIAARFPQFGVTGAERGCFEPTAGYVRPETCIRVQLEAAERHGARIIRNTRVLGVTHESGGVGVHVEGGTFTADRCVISAGAWVSRFIPQPLRRHFTVYPQTLVWYALRDGVVDHSPQAMPVYIWALGGRACLYGFPALDGAAAGVKVGVEQFERSADPDDLGDPDPEEPRRVHADVVGRCLPGLSAHPLKTLRCLYTTTPDSGFVIDRHPDSDRVLLVSPCSGHGFKHSAGLGDALAELLTTGASPIDLSSFSLARFAQPAG